MTFSVVLISIFCLYTLNSQEIIDSVCVSNSNTEFDIDGTYKYWKTCNNRTIYIQYNSTDISDDPASVYIIYFDELSDITSTTINAFQFYKCDTLESYTNIASKTCQSPKTIEMGCIDSHIYCVPGLDPSLMMSNEEIYGNGFKSIYMRDFYQCMNWFIQDTETLNDDQIYGIHIQPNKACQSNNNNNNINIGVGGGHKNNYDHGTDYQPETDSNKAKSITILWVIIGSLMGIFCIIIILSLIYMRCECIWDNKYANKIKTVVRPMTRDTKNTELVKSDSDDEGIIDINTKTVQ